MPDKAKSSGAGVYNKRIAGSGGGEVLTRLSGEKVMRATDEEAALRVQELTESLQKSNKRLSLEDFLNKHKDTMDDLNMSGDPAALLEYKKQLDADRKKRMKQIKKRRKDEVKKKKEKKKKKKEKKKKKKKDKKKKKQKQKSETDDSSDDDDDSDSRPKKKHKKTEEKGTADQNETDEAS
mmetsp:Transcript_13083/g.23757  ORF Transcript_13083/g.23757 Transcript_13083/m.23757 type:complete len:180 (+) Transcript_13083:391-930(+)|eukprot:CAMPEP_0197521612 /NCGR_PEP_ID=MMETSP1318-20131121/6878_1 /TAXON_ID=552666 /ORGANISM="Partenskyella glossopodia, Strain RCC365" /LENGTH=179 /DNA_ID=CAMNT_0043073673 /DNA_START=377 /DNA_END=916 /DNA_ORIENTATION=-